VNALDTLTDATADGPPARAPGRPRSSAADEAILEAAVDVFAEVGLEALTMERVAARAGVGKNTVYRRYPSKVELVVSAVRCYTDAGKAPPDTGTTAGDLQALVDDLAAIVTNSPMGRMLPILVAVRTRVPELDAAYSDIVAHKRARSAAVVRRAIARGDLRADVDVELVVDGIVSPVFYRFLVTHAPLDDAFRVAVADAVLAAYGKRQPKVDKMASST
jgi:AcrR family transcriptional regulator